MVKYKIPLVKDEQGRDVLKYFPKHSDFPAEVRAMIKGVNFVLQERVAILESEVPIPDLETKEDVEKVEQELIR